MELRDFPADPCLDPDSCRYFLRQCLSPRDISVLRYLSSEFGEKVLLVLLSYSA